MLEIPIRIAGITSELYKNNFRYEIERRFRGYIYSLFFQTEKIRLDSNVALEGLSNITIGNNVSLYRYVELVAGSRSQIKIGNGSHLGRKTLVSGLGGVIIGSNCSISSHVSIFSSTNNTDGSITQGKVVIDDNVLIGTGVSILPGVNIGKGASIGAGAVVVKDVEANEIVIGIPAKKLIR